ncbi:hypothetical protein ACROYT_G006302 [Oculina patagonica]
MASVSDDCIFCKEPVRERQQGVQCDGCSKWNHRTCNTGISQEAYRTAVREGADITWCCASCLGDPVAESTMNGETSADILVSEEFNPPLDSSADLFEQSMEVAESVTSEQEQSMDTSYAAVFDQSMEVAEAVTSEQEQSMVQELGLQTVYNSDQGTHDLIRKMMALPFLPAKIIKQSFQKLKRKATSDALKKFAKYVEKTWIKSTTWPPKSWSVYMQSIRTNNDVEGWHNGLNRRAQGKSQLPFYMLITLLHEESRLTTLQIRMVSEQKLRRYQRKTYRQLQARIFSLWDQHKNGEKTVKQLLTACSKLHGPRTE